MSQRLFCLCLIFAILSACKPGAQHQQEQSSKQDISGKSHGFDELSSQYYENENRVIWQKPDLVLSLMGNLKGKTVADIGAGTGFFSFRVANQGAKVIAIDIDPRAIAWINAEKARYPVEVQALLETRLAAPDNPNLKAGEVDVVLMVNTYIYIQNRVSYFRNLSMGLKPNAQVIIIDFKDKETPIGPKLEERLSMDDVEKELTAAGYSVTMADDTSLTYQYIIKASLQ